MFRWLGCHFGNNFKLLNSYNFEWQKCVLDVHRIWLKSQQHSGVSWFLVSTNLDSRLKKYSCRTNSTFQRMRVSQHWFRPLGQQIQKLYKPRFRPLGQQETKTLQAYWNYLAWFNLLLGLRTRIVFFLLGNIHCGKKSRRLQLNISNHSSDFKWILNLKNVQSWKFERK